MNAEQIATAPCPSCKGSGHLPIVHQLPGCHVPAPWRGKTRRCLSCKARGEVEAWRVCAGCGNWRDGCMCRPTVEIVKLERVRVEVTRAEATPVRDEESSVEATPVALPLGEPLPLGLAPSPLGAAQGARDKPMPEQEAVSYPPPPSRRQIKGRAASRAAQSAPPTCPWGLSTCALADQGEGFYFCSGCCFARQE